MKQKAKQKMSRFIALFMAFSLIAGFGIGSGSVSNATEPGEIIYSTGFEDGMDGFNPRGGASLTRTNDLSQNGDYSLHVTNRTANWHGASLNLSDVVVPGGQYRFSAWFYAPTDQGETNYIMGGEYNEGFEGNRHPWLANSWLTGGQVGTWVEFSTVVTLPDAMTSFNLNFEHQNPNVDFLIDNVTVTLLALPEGGGEVEPEFPDSVDEGGDVPEGAREIFSANFINGLGGFGNRGTASLSRTREILRQDWEGNHVMRISARGEENWHGARAEIASRMVPGGEYFFEAWVYGEESVEYQLTLHVEMPTGTQDLFPDVATTQTFGRWVRITGEYVAPQNFTAVGLNIQTAGDTRPDIFVDEVRVYAMEGTDVPDIYGGFDREATPLKDIYANYFTIGNIYTPAFPGDARGELLAHHFNVITAENIMKPDHMQPQQGVFAFANPDAMMDWAIENDMDVIGHTLVWHSQSFNWLEPLSPTREEAIAIMQEHIRTVMGHYNENYPGLISAWDVVNEAIAPRNGVDPANWRAHLRDTKWLRFIGEDYLNIAFETAREMDPNATLYYNDYNLNDNFKATIVANMVRELREEGVPIDAIGMQGHYNSQTPMATVRNSLELFTSTIPGITMGFTEVDITFAGHETEDRLPLNLEIRQGQMYAQLMQIFMDFSDNIERVTFWGMADPDSWRADRHPNLFHGDLSGKLAFYAVADPEGFLAEYPVEEGPASLTAYAANGTPELGEFDASAYANSPIIPIANQMTAHNGATGTARVLWDENYLYVLTNVADSTPDVSAANVHEHDSVEIFISYNNSKNPFYTANQDFQLRVNRENLQTAGSTGIIDGFESFVGTIPGGYQVEVRIPVENPFLGRIVGFDLQINDGRNGVRESFSKWNDHTDMSWQSTEFWGNLMLVGADGPSTVTPEPPEVVDPEVPETTLPTIPPTTSPGGPGTPDPETPGPGTPPVPETPVPAPNQPPVPETPAPGNNNNNQGSGTNNQNSGNNQSGGNNQVASNDQTDIDYVEPESELLPTPEIPIVIEEVETPEAEAPIFEDAAQISTPSGFVQRALIIGGIAVAVAVTGIAITTTLIARRKKVKK